MLQETTDKLKADCTKVKTNLFTSSFPNLLCWASANTLGNTMAEAMGVISQFEGAGMHFFLNLRNLLQTRGGAQSKSNGGSVGDGSMSC